ncbi:MAG: family 20 glycosylhydrolase [Myxococcota bacterium]
MPTGDAPPLRLLPAPRRIERLERGPAASAPEVATLRDPSQEAQSFELQLDVHGVRIRHRDAAGLRYARATLEQIRGQSPGGLPGLRIVDGPDLPVRGYMLDVSRDRVPTRASLEQLVKRLDLLRINHLELYTEHTFAYREHEPVWRDASPLTALDIRWLDDLCRQRGIELAANQNCFGHMERWLRHEAYRPLAEVPDGTRTRQGEPRAAATLAPSAESLAFVQGLLAELVPNFASRRVNVGCDETFELGRGRSAAAVRERGAGRVYLEFLLGILESVHEMGREALFWGDILRHHPELVGELPRRDTIALAWHYEAPLEPSELPGPVRERLADFGLSDVWLSGFEAHVEPFASADLPFWVCPGTSTWNALLGRWPNARANLADAASVAAGSGAGGMLVTDWGDNGHLQPPSQSLLPLAYGAAVAWCFEANLDLEVAPLLDAFVFEDDAGELGGALEAMGCLDALTGLQAMNASPLHAALLGNTSQRTWGRIDADGLGGLHEALARIGARIEASRPGCADGEAVQRELLQGLRLARHGAWRLAREVDLPRPPEAELGRDLTEAIAEQRACWLASSRPGGLDDSLSRLERTLAEYTTR